MKTNITYNDFVKIAGSIGFMATWADFNNTFYLSPRGEKINDEKFYTGLGRLKDSGFSFEIGPRAPKIGEKIYTPTRMSISNGSTDVAGGLATVENIVESTHVPKGHPNYYFVYTKETPSYGWNWASLLNSQDEFAEKYKGRIAQPDPDVDRPWIENGDYVDGEKYSIPPIW